MRTVPGEMKCPLFLPQEIQLQLLQKEVFIMDTELQPQASVSTLSMTLGLFALGIAWRNAALLLDFPAAIGEGILGATGLLWLFLLLRYIRQVITSTNGAARECILQLGNPFLTLVPITTSLAAVALRPYAPFPACILLLLGVAGQLLFSSYHIGGQWHGRTPVEMETPAMYMPTIGANFASAIALGAFGYAHWGYLFFGAGFLSWMSLESSFLHHLRADEPLHPQKRPLLGIQLAPSFVGSSAYLSCNGGQIDAVVLGLVGYGLLNLLFMARLMTWVLRVGLSMSLWAFSFAMASMVNVGFRIWHAGFDDSFVLLGQFFTIFGTAVILLLLAETALLLARSFSKQ